MVRDTHTDTYTLPLHQDRDKILSRVTPRKRRTSPTSNHTVTGACVREFWKIYHREVQQIKDTNTAQLKYAATRVCRAAATASHTVPLASPPINAAHAPQWPHSYSCLCERIRGKLHYKMEAQQAKGASDTAQLQHVTLHGCWAATASLTYTLPLASPPINAAHDPNGPTLHSEAMSYLAPRTRLMADPRPPRMSAVKHNKSLTSINTRGATLCPDAGGGRRRRGADASGKAFRATHLREAAARPSAAATSIQRVIKRSRNTNKDNDILV